MDENAMIDDLIRMLDNGMAGGVGHINVEVDPESNRAQLRGIQAEEYSICTAAQGHKPTGCDSKTSDCDVPPMDCEVQTMGCTDCSATPLACSVPTLMEGLDR